MRLERVHDLHAKGCGMRIGMGCKAQTTDIALAMARICNAADRPRPRLHTREEIVNTFLAIRMQHPAVTPRLLGAVHGHVGVAQQGFSIITILRVQGDTNADSHVHGVATDINGFAYRGQNAGGCAFAFRGISHRCEQDNKFIPTKAGYRIFSTDAGL